MESGGISSFRAKRFGPVHPPLHLTRIFQHEYRHRFNVSGADFHFHPRDQVGRCRPKPNGLSPSSPGLAEWNEAYPGNPVGVSEPQSGSAQGGVEHASGAQRPLGLNAPGRVSQGSACRATLGWRMEHRWRSQTSETKDSLFGIIRDEDASKIQASPHRLEIGGGVRSRRTARIAQTRPARMKAPRLRIETYGSEKRRGALQEGYAS
jgi:hypothetical protein